MALVSSHKNDCILVLEGHRKPSVEEIFYEIRKTWPLIDAVAICDPGIVAWAKKYAFKDDEEYPEIQQGIITITEESKERRKSSVEQAIRDLEDELIGAGGRNEMVEFSLEELEEFNPYEEYVAWVEPDGELYICTLLKFLLQAEPGDYKIDNILYHKMDGTCWKNL